MVEGVELDGEGAAAVMPLASSSPAPVSFILIKDRSIFYLKDWSIFIKTGLFLFKRLGYIYLKDRSIFY